MPIRIIDNKKLDLTNDEFDLYNQLCKTYTTAHRQGSSLFQDLFESDDKGLIVFLKPPSQRAVSYEILFFLMQIMTHQRLRLIQDEAQSLADQLKSKMKEFDIKIADLDKKLAQKS